MRDPDRVAFITQTTLSVMDTRDVIAALRQRFPNIVGPDTKDICYATQNRQKAVLDLAARVDLLLVVGSANSSNASRLQEIGPDSAFRAISSTMPRRSKRGGSMASSASGYGRASTPEHLVQDTLRWLATLRPSTSSSEKTGKSACNFRVPERLTAAAPSQAPRQASLVRP